MLVDQEKQERAIGLLVSLGPAPGTEATPWYLKERARDKEEGEKEKEKQDKGKRKAISEEEREKKDRKLKVLFIMISNGTAWRAMCISGMNAV